MSEEHGRPEPYEPGPPVTEDEDRDADRAAQPSREELAARGERIARSRKPMGPEPEDDRRDAREEEGPPADVPPTPPPEPADG